MSMEDMIERSRTMFAIGYALGFACVRKHHTFAGLQKSWLI